MSGIATEHEPRWMRVLYGSLPWAIWLFLMAFAWRFADERLYADSGYYLARVINEGGFRIEHGRWVLALAELLAWVGAELGFGLKALIVLHSLNNVLWLGACMLFASRILKDRDAMLALAAVHLIGLTHGLFCPVFELYYGVDLLVLFHATWRSDHLPNALRWVLLAVFFFGAITSHFFAMLLASGLLCFERVWRDRTAAIALVCLLIAVLVFHMNTLTKYERGGLAWLGDLARPNKVYGLFSALHLKEFIVYAARHYADIAVLCVTAIIALRKQQWALLVGVAMIFVLYICSGLYRPGFIHDRYREQVNFATTAWVLILLCSRVLPMVRWQKPVLVMLAMAGMFRMVRAEWIATWYTERTSLIQARVERAHELGMTKAIVAAPVYFGPPNHLIDLSWSTSVESVLLSSKDGADGTVSLITTEDLAPPQVRAYLDRFVFRRWDVFDPSWLDPRYFKAPTGRYVPLPGDPVP